MKWRNSLRAGDVVEVWTDAFGDADEFGEETALYRVVDVLEEGFLGYGPADGLRELRPVAFEAIAGYRPRERDPADEFDDMADVDLPEVVALENDDSAREP